MNVGIIGCGNIASAHIKALSKNQYVEKIALYDPDDSKVKTRQKETIKQTYCARNLSELAEIVDCVIICTPNNLHKDLLENVLKNRSIPFICEKPLASTVEDAKIITTIAPVDCIISFNYRFNYIFSYIKEYIDREKLGKCLFFSAEFNKNSAIVRKELTWRDDSNQSFSSGALGDLSCHLLDLFCWFTEDKINIKTLNIASGTRIKKKGDLTVKVDDNGFIFGQSDNNSFFKIKASKSETEESLGLHLHIIFSDAEIEYTTRFPLLIKIKRLNSVEKIEIQMKQNKELSDPEREIPYWADSFINMHQAWFDKIVKNVDNPNLPTVFDGYHIQEVISRIADVAQNREY